MEMKFTASNSIYNDTIFFKTAPKQSHAWFICFISLDLTESLASIKKSVSFMNTKAASV